ncbi:MAG: ATP synthase F0 subunit C [Thermodesulfovibrionales bacterium]|nr:ATP synthase F0 subunit C [Thermodesulfovibrionales bacterium]
MKKVTTFAVLAMAFVMMLAPLALATEEAAPAAAVSGSDSLKAMGALAAGLAIGIAAFGAAIGQGLGLSRACEGVARNPGASGKITTTLIIGLAMIESLAIYALLVSLGILINLKLFF